MPGVRAVPQAADTGKRQHACGRFSVYIEMFLYVVAMPVAG